MRSKSLVLWIASFSFVALPKEEEFVQWFLFGNVLCKPI